MSESLSRMNQHSSSHEDTDVMQQVKGHRHFTSGVRRCMFVYLWVGLVFTLQAFRILQRSRKI